MRALLALATLPACIQALTPQNESSFSSPPPSQRLTFRYWLPDASVNTSTVQSNILSSAEIGAGGIEFLPLYNYGASLGPPPEGADWAKDGFGTRSFNEVFKGALQAARDAGLSFDFAVGPSQGQGVPADVGDEGLHWDLAPFNATIMNGRFSGIIPGWGTGELVALVSAEVVSKSTIQNPSSETFMTPATNSTRLVLRSSSVMEHTSQVSSNGTVSLRFNTDNEVRLFAYYQYRDLVKNLDIETNTTGTIFDNGSYTVDHFSARGAQTVIDFWENHILNDSETRSLLEDVGRYAWEDSIEIKSNISWTPSLPTLFKDHTGYEIQKYLPLIQFGNNNPGVQPSYPGDLKCLLDSADSGQGIVNDYRAVLGKGYQSYLSALTNWTESLGLAFSAQVSYNLPLDMESSIPFVSAPECESLAFKDNIDGYRQFSGVANSAGQKIISNEMGANLRESFRLTLSHLLWQINSAFAGGVNQIVLHGQTYSGNYYDTTWPGYIGFFMLFSESYSDKQPGWRHSYPQMIEYVSRTQYILQSGEPRTDIAFLNKASVTDPEPSTIYQGGDLEAMGCSYSYISPDNLNLTGLGVEDGVLGYEAPRYNAIVVLSEQNVTMDAVRKLQEYADGELPVLFAGGLPGLYPSGNNTNEKGFNTALKTLQGSDNVYSVDQGKIASKLAALNIAPRVQVQLDSSSATWYPVYRSDADTEYVFLFSSQESTRGNVTVQTTKTPYFFNAWSGVRTPVLHYQVGGDSTTIPLSLAGNQTTILAFSDELKNEVDTPEAHAISLPDSVIGYEYSNNRLEVHALASSTNNQRVVLSNGKTHSLQSHSTRDIRSVTLSNWTLTAEHWAAPSNVSAAHIEADKYNTTHHLSGPSIPSWVDIPGLNNISGVGYYSSTFTWPSNQTTAGKGNRLGAYISLPPVSHGFQLAINDIPVPGIDLFNPVVDISSYLQPGVNKVDVIVPTVMWNYIRSIYDEIEISGSPPLLDTTGELPELVENGLVGVYNRNSR
ncbi:hypothetical protein BDV18DRAFT_153809 [Aspergillus unguis]